MIADLGPAEQALVFAERELCSRHFIDFVERAWPQVDPRPFIRSWHVDAVCEHIEAVAAGDILNLVINMPPGLAKSLLCNVFYPAWRWIWESTWQGLFATHRNDLTIRDSDRCRALIKSDWYQARWPVEFSKTQDTKFHFVNEHKGSRYCTTVGGSVLGFRGDGAVVDDPQDPGIWPSEGELVEVQRWFREKLSTRFNDADNASVIVIMQRLHEEDLSGHILEELNDDGSWEHLCLPAKYDPDRHCKTSIGWEDPRNRPGDVLCHKIQSNGFYDKQRVRLSSRGFSSQYQQKPVSAEGNIIRVEWTNRMYKQSPMDVARLCSKVILSCDLATGKGKSKDRRTQRRRSYSVLDLWGYKHPNFYLLDSQRDRWGYNEIIRQINMILEVWPVTKTLVESAAAGIQVYEDLKTRYGSKVENWQPLGDKVQRCHAVTPAWEANRVVLPDPSMSPWIEPWIQEIVGFPAAAHDDRVDAMTQCLLYLGVNSATHWMMK